MMKHKWALLAVLVAALFLSACDAPDVQEGSTSSSAAPTGSALSNNTEAGIINPSQLISRSEAEEILGVALGEAENSEQPAVGMKLCLYQSEDAMLQITITQQALMMKGQTPETVYRAIVDNFENAEKVEGVGDEACFATPGIHILQSGYYLSITVGNAPNREEVLIKAGKLAVNNLQAKMK